MHRAKIAFFAGLASLFILGYALGSALAFHPKLEPFKLLNIVGLTYDLLGLFTLSEAVLQSPRWSRLFVTWIAGLLIWGQSVVPLGAVVGAWLAEPAPSSPTATSFFIAFFINSMLPLALLDGLVFNPHPLITKDIESRIRRMGFGLLVMGVVVQLVAAFKDLYP